MKKYLNSPYKLKGNPEVFEAGEKVPSYSTGTAPPSEQPPLINREISIFPLLLSGTATLKSMAFFFTFSAQNFESKKTRVSPLNFSTLNELQKWLSRTAPPPLI